MDGFEAQPEILDPRPFRIALPEPPFAPVVFASAHSGRGYTAELLAGVRLRSPNLRRSEDSFVDELFAAAPAHGATLLAAHFPRAFCDANREPWELDPGMFADTLPEWVNTTSPRVTAGLGTIAKVVASGEPIYGAKLSFAEAERRIQTYWLPFHDALRRIIADIKARFGYCLLIDCHSMPSGGPGSRIGGRAVDFVLGDLHGVACSPRVTRAVEAFLSARGFQVRRNDPYAGGYITKHYGRPGHGVHALQVEVARRLYMDETLIERSADFARIEQAIAGLIGAITQQAPGLIG
ncbi:N-formylglutamate amidohydrolase [Rhodopila globiformis]|uniref:N-formylglutamate amidohydrolase n=1 Tax=Rhodopila globiformis TaxID=1071 RepID=A0A2S6N0J4_RHOGL|nr:N-formylglutamate amidohydrolase [Rhodopila globiformis]PPQ28118.1 N-formylglutamate amidohydrolase [Rhodopila globiformis]